MKVFRFIKWSWTNARSDTRSLITMAGILSVLGICVAIGGLLGLFIFLGFLFTILVSFVLYQIFKKLKNEWEKYNQHLAYEQDLIVDRLRRGIRS